VTRFDAVDPHGASMVAVTADANPLDDPADAAALADHSASLAAAVDTALAAWVERVVRERWAQWRGEPLPAAVATAAQAAAAQARAEVMPRLLALLATDVDEQRSNPLAVIRSATRHPTGVLRDAGVPPVERDHDARRLFPDDLYDLTPATFADLDPSVHEPGLVWGAAKAHVVLRRRRKAAH
jgi:hypothetical protein